jgi:hypothetical protein
MTDTHFGSRTKPSTFDPRLAVVAGALAWAALGAACVPDDASDATPEIVSETTQGLTTTSTVTTRGVDLTPNVLADWTMDRQIRTALVTNHTLKVRYCEAHFPPTSQALANLMAALGAYSGAPGVAINLVDVAPAAGTSTHPADLSTFPLPADAIYVDFSPDLASDVFASTGLPSASCDSSSPRQCTQARLYVNDDKVSTDPPSMGVFMHELGHVFGMKHINEDDDSVTKLNPNDMWFDRTTVHGLKHQSDDFRGLVIHAGTLAFLRQYYPATTTGTLDTDEIVAHHNMSMVQTVGTVTSHYEWDPAKAYGGWGTAGALVAGLNDVKLRWNPTADVGTGVAGGFEPCSAAPGTLPHWFARMSETSTNTVDKLFESVFEVTNNDLGTNWSQVATHTFDSYVAGQADFRQIDWDKTFALPPAAFGLPATGVTAKTLRQLRFRADANNSLAERNEVNNEWQVNLCLYPAGSTCPGTCAQ